VCLKIIKKNAFLISSKSNEVKRKLDNGECYPKIINNIQPFCFSHDKILILGYLLFSNFNKYQIGASFKWDNRGVGAINRKYRFLLAWSTLVHTL